jgi:hypothetical protein
MHRLAQLDPGRHRGLSCLWALVWILAGCSPSPGDPRAEIAALVDEGVAAVEAGDHRALAALAASDYEDAEGRNRARLALTLRALMTRYPGITVAVQSLDVELDSPALARAEVTLLVLARRQGAPLPVGLEAERIRLRLALRRDADWRVTRAERI